MVKYIKRTTDNQFLQSFENDIWVEDKKDGYKMTYRECEVIKEELLTTYSLDQIVEISDLFDFKSISKDEKKELKNLLKK